MSDGTQVASAVRLSRADVEAAARWLTGRVRRTPVLSSPVIDALAGARVLIKAENLQLSGSYKMRGALLAISRLAAAGTHPGVVAQSTGNHALAVAMAARDNGLAATVVLPADAPAGKVAKAQDAGARVILIGSTVDERLAVVRQICDETGYAVIDAYDHRDVVAGQGSASLELIEQARADGTPLDALVRSLEAGQRVAVPPGPPLADGLRPSLVGALPFEIVRETLSGVVRVDDEAIANAFRLVLFHLKLLAEPSGAAALAGALRIAATGAHRTIGVVLTGGNVESEVVARLVAEPSADLTILEGLVS
jgi:threonine dehydratase